ncbi:MAG: AAA family ATPase [Leptospira sp.]|nr:AAA family ATPase [Leptospira sp.]
MNLFPQIQTEADSGFRLSRLEFLNWGTFDKKIWEIPAGGETFLLTGANGSGKSTIVDAILTLLVPLQKRNYNLAAGVDNKKKDRNEKSYVEGYFGKGDGQDGILKVRSKPEDCFSVLLGVFVQKERQEYVSIAQVFWSENGEIKKFFIFSNKDMSIEKDFLGRATIKELKVDLKKAGHGVLDNFKAYSTEFRHAVGLRSEKGIDLFNQIVAIKSLGHLNDFVREHMLEGKDIRSKIEELDRNFTNLNETYMEISKARDQLAILVPIQNRGKELTATDEILQHINQTIRALPYYFLNLERQLLETENQKILRDEEIEKEKQTSLAKEILALQEEERRLLNALETNDTQRRISDLNGKLDSVQEEKSRREKKRNSYLKLGKELSLNLQLTEEDFYSQYDQAKLRLENGKFQREALRETIIQLSGEKAGLEKALMNIRVELEYLKKNQNLIPESQARIRQEICKTLNLSEDELPYSCELIQVKDSESEWKGALERLLRSFGLRLLVPDKYYHTITSFVNRTHLGARLVYSRMVEHGNKLLPKNKDEVFYKLELKPGMDTSTKEWLESQVLREFDYVCTDMERFSSIERAITREGLIKSGKIRHEKDDRRNINDSRNFILGWDNKEKIAALEKEFIQLGESIYNLDGELRENKMREEKLDKESGLLHRFLDYNIFRDVDSLSLIPQMEEILSQLKILEEESKEYQALKEQSNLIRKQLDESIVREKSLTKKINNYEYRRDQIKKDLESIESSLFEIPQEELAEITPSIESYLTQKPTDQTVLTELKTMERILHSDLEKKRKSVFDEKEKIQDDLIRKMTKFIQSYPDDSNREELNSEVAALESFQSYLEKLQKERLPEFESRFRSMMDDKVSKQILEFKAGLEDDVDEIKERIDELNESLRYIDYQKDKTYIQLKYFDTKQKEISGDEGFKVMLRDCIPNVGNPEENEGKFMKIKNLLSRLKAEEESDRWSRLVTDARNWLDFQVQEFEKESQKIKEVYDSSAGKSGGQTVKLAYTILASAIFYQFGLRNRKSFRFVVIDEMFNNLDNQNAGFAMDLFKKLGLQLMVVTPMDKINVVEPFIQSVHFVKINPEGNRSSVHSITMEEIHEKMGSM